MTFFLVTGRKLNIHDVQKTSWMSPERLMYAQFASCIQEVRCRDSLPKALYISYLAIVNMFIETSSLESTLAEESADF